MDYHGSHETWLRIWRLEERQDGMRDQIKDHETRIETLETSTLLSPQMIKEASMVLLIGFLAGSILTAKDPAGAITLVERLLRKG